MINLNKQHRLNQLNQSHYDQLKDDIDHINTLIPKLRNVDYRLFHVDDDYNQSRSQRLQSSSIVFIDDYDQLAQDFLDSLAKIEDIQSYYPLETKPLYLELLEESMDVNSLWGFPSDESYFDKEQVRKLNACIRLIQYLLREEDVSKEIKRIQRQQKRQTDSIQNYIRSLIYQYARLEVLRIDLGYLSEIPIRYAEIHRHRELMVRYLNENHLGNAHVGFVWKLEYGLRKSYHLHMMIFLDGSKVQRSVLHGKLICDYWNKTVTNGRGTSFNCNGKMDDYQECGIGTVDYYDQDKINSLLKISRYLTKYDPFIDIMLQHEAQVELDEGNQDLSVQISKGRVFGKAQLPDIRIKRGRTRSFNREGEWVLGAILLEHHPNEAI